MILKQIFYTFKFKLNFIRFYIFLNFILIFRSADDKRVVMVGNGKLEFGKVFVLETGTTGGAISGHK